MIKNVYIKDYGFMNTTVDFVLKNQLKNREVWKKTVEVFYTREDTEHARWRGEYFGKQMRGAVLVYKYSKDDELYDILTDTATDMLAAQDKLGRFSTYEVEREFCGWDMWCRKYVLVGFIYYLKICKDNALKERIINACKQHLDYIVEKIGSGENQTEITNTSHWWGCVNSCTILEPTVEMYKLTGEQRYMDFAKYVISTGGSSDCNLIELALNGEKLPYQYPVTKAYEIMSFYEGLLAYYEVTGEDKYFNAVTRFMDAVEESDITIIGCAGCTHELFDNSAKMQTEYHENIMQETCVTVTWMRVNRRLFEITGKSKYIDRLEKSGFNAMYGSLNTELNKQFCVETNSFVEGSVFDSYSPLYMNTRGRGIGGFNEFKSGGYNGCCIAIGACGIALMPLSAVMQDEGKVYVNMLINGNAIVKDKLGKFVDLNLKSNYPADGDGVITVGDDCCMSIYIRKPAHCDEMTVNGENVAGEYFVLDKEFAKGERIEILIKTGVKCIFLNKKVAFTYGALALATDEWKCGKNIKNSIEPTDVRFERIPAKNGEFVRFIALFKDGNSMLLSDYQSCGKKWLSEQPLMTAWFNCK